MSSVLTTYQPFTPRASSHVMALVSRDAAVDRRRLGGTSELERNGARLDEVARPPPSPLKWTGGRVPDLAGRAKTSAIKV